MLPVDSSETVNSSSVPDFPASDSVRLWPCELRKLLQLAVCRGCFAGPSREENVKDVWLLSGPGRLGKPRFLLPHRTWSLAGGTLLLDLALLLVSCGPDSRRQVGGREPDLEGIRV